ncbi:MAG: cytochrome-c peroxidase [Bacteroidetes bacterium SW_11_45_7]|nr:MAG: cytochrome-c peroxidase [Bacteroidetes bacterium SW_11_45_7]
MKTILSILGALIGAALMFGVGFYVSQFLFKEDVPPPPPPDYFSETSGGSRADLTGGDQKIVEVRDGESIRNAVADAEPGTIIRVYPGRYNETIFIDKDFKIMNYKGNGIMGQAGNNFVIRNNWVKDAGIYGIFPEYGKNGLIEHNIISGIADAAIYVGMCDNIDVRYNEVHDNVAGIEIENSRKVLVEGNYAHNNAGAIFALITPGLPIKNCRNVIFRSNYVINNNHENFGEPGSIVGKLPKGTGIIVLAADKVTMENNIVMGNDNVGIAVTDLSFTDNMDKDPKTDPYPDSLVILDNLMANNGNNPVGQVKTLGKARMSYKGLDILAMGGGKGSCIKDRSRYRTWGLDGYGACPPTTTTGIQSYMLDKPAEPRDVDKEREGKLVYYGVCSGCHAYDTRLIGPKVTDIQKIRADQQAR